jgi:electron transport complex protein RnfG
MSASSPSVLRTALRLAAFTAGTAALLATAHWATREPIAAGERRAQLATLAALLPAQYDNDPVGDRIEILAPDGLGGEVPRSVWRARRGGEPAGAVLSVLAPDGYGGPIELLVGVDAEGRVIGARVIRHRETPGLGDPIERERSDWIEGFDGRGIGDPPASRWAVRRDGGDFDQFAGATITPRAVVGAVRRALTWFSENRETVFAGTGVSSPVAEGPGPEVHDSSQDSRE